ncbi:MAG: HAD-IA family hydrolase [Lachnospiraceae bacterium]|nr:HAD-IA family hydrolase [Lachnospiraceae bacterium]
MKKSKLAIFDLDGTLFDTRDVNFYAYQQAMVELGYSLDYDTYTNTCNGKYYKDYLPLLINHPSEELMEDIHDRKTRYYPEYLDKAKVNEHLFYVMNKLKEDYYLALVTTASKKNTEDILKCFGKLEIFDLILTHNDVEKKKPDPEGFLKAMNFFHINADNTIIYEDSDVGIEAAKRSGASVMGVINI